MTDYASHSIGFLKELFRSLFIVLENEVSAQGVAAGSTSLTSSSTKSVPNLPWSNTIYSPSYAKLNYQGGRGGWMPATNNIGEWLGVGTLFDTLKIMFISVLDSSISFPYEERQSFALLVSSSANKPFNSQS